MSRGGRNQRRKKPASIPPSAEMRNARELVEAWEGILRRVREGKAELSASHVTAIEVERDKAILRVRVLEKCNGDPGRAGNAGAEGAGGAAGVLSGAAQRCNGGRDEAAFDEEQGIGGGSAGNVPGNCDPSGATRRFRPVQRGR